MFSAAGQSTDEDQFAPRALLEPLAQTRAGHRVRAPLRGVLVFEGTPSNPGPRCSKTGVETLPGCRLVTATTTGGNQEGEAVITPRRTIMVYKKDHPLEIAQLSDT